MFTQWGQTKCTPVDTPIYQHVIMNWSNYKCDPTPTNLSHFARHRLKQPRCSEPKGFAFVKNDSNFDLLSYTGKFPAVVVLNHDTVIGWTNDRHATSYKQLEPWKTNPPPIFFWGQPTISVQLTYRQAIDTLRQHCRDVKDLRVGVPEQTTFEQGRQTLWALALADSHVNLQKIVDMEVAYMKVIVTHDARILQRCVKIHNLDMPTVECLEAHIRKQYATSSANTTVTTEFFKMVTGSVVGMLGI